MCTLFKFLRLLLMGFSLGVGYFQASSNEWSFPEDYPTLLEKALERDHDSQEEICRLIYKGILRFPQRSNTNHQELFKWLDDTHPGHSFQRKLAYFFFKNGKIKDAKEIFEKIEQLANNGDIYAQRFMGSCYFYIEEIGTDHQETALNWYKKAAENGHPRAQMSLALRYLKGGHLEKNPQKALRWTQKAADAGLPEALATLASLYLNGEIVPQDINKGYSLLLEDAHKGDTDAQLELTGYYFLAIKGASLPVQRNLQEGLKWLIRSENSGNVDALFFHGYLLYAGIAFSRDQDEGMRFIIKAAKLGSENAQKYLERREQAENLFLKKKIPNKRSAKNDALSEAFGQNQKVQKYSTLTAIQSKLK